MGGDCRPSLCGEFSEVGFITPAQKLCRGISVNVFTPNMIATDNSIAMFCCEQENPVGTGAFHIIDPSVLYFMFQVFERECASLLHFTKVSYIAFTVAMPFRLRLCNSGSRRSIFDLTYMDDFRFQLRG